MMNTLETREFLPNRNDLFVPVEPFPAFFEPCIVKVLVVTDGGLHFGEDGVNPGMNRIDDFGLATFIKTFRQLELDSWLDIKYQVTIAHRGNPGNVGMMAGHPHIHERITSFRFNDPTHFTTIKYDQVWLFGISTNYVLDPMEVKIVEDYMDHGGGLFATGDHGTLGRSLCGDIKRVKDMRVWRLADAPPGEVDMIGALRNDTNQPQPGDVSSHRFGDQEDNIPQVIHPKLYGGSPHPLLSCHTSINPWGVLNKMPDHPHEGQCQPEKDFTITTAPGVTKTIRTQNIAISFVLAGNDAGGGKAATIPHCFPSIGVWDGHPANTGRIVVDSTWHHFVNVNLRGFDANHLKQVTQYYKNIATWMTRRKNMLCRIKRLVIDVLRNDRIIEASANRPELPGDKFPVDELYSIGVHLFENIAKKYSPAEALVFKMAHIEPHHPKLTEALNVWNAERKADQDNPSNNWVNAEPLINIAFGYAVVHFRDQYGEVTERITAQMEQEVDRIFEEGLAMGLQRGFELMNKELKSWIDLSQGLDAAIWVATGTITDAKGTPQAGLTVKVFDADDKVGNLLGSTQTNEKGQYTIRYRRVDFDPNNAEQGTADLIANVYDGTGKEVGRSDIMRDAPQKATLNVQIG